MTQSMIHPDKVILPNVPRIHFYEGGPRCPEDLPFPSVMRAVLEYQGENLGCSHCRPPGREWGLGCGYAYFCGVTGIAFQHAWKPGWHDDSLIPERMPNTATPPGQPWSLGEPYRRAFGAVGYSCQAFGPQAGEEAIRAQICASIRERGQPVIAFGIVGPPEPVIITGYDEDGAVLVGWSFFQGFPPFNEGLEFEPNGYFRKRNWFPELKGLIIPGAKGEIPDQAAVLEDSLRWGLQILRTPAVDGVPTGLAAYDAWAADLLRDADFAGTDEAVLRRNHQAHDFVIGYIAEARWYGSVWLAKLYEKAHYNRSEWLLKAAGCMAGEHALMWDLWNLAGGNGSPDAWQKFADPHIRRQMIPVIQASRERAAEAADHIERALGL